MVENKLAKLAHGSSAPKGRIPLLLLLAAHVPYLLTYWISLWSQSHYQFFPFALAAFVWLFFSRRNGNVPRWSVASLVLFGMDVLCLGIGVWLNSPWLVAVGMIAWLLAWSLNFADETDRRSLGYLVLLPLMTIRLPLNMDQNAIHWLQRMTTTVASQFLNQLKMLHVREGNIIEFPGKSFLIAEACSGVQSLFTILFLASLVICLRRRSFVHGILLLCSGFAFAGLMNIARVMTIAVAWQTSALDLSTGLVHEVLGYCCLAIAAALLMSADACLGFFLDCVPDRRRLGATVLFRNPLVVFWNLLFGHRGSKVSSKSSSKSSTKESAYAEQPRTLPTGLNLLKPHYWFHFLIGFIDTWLHSRKYRELITGFPFIVAAICGTGLMLWLRHGSEDSVIKSYREGLVEAQQDSDLIREEMYLKALCSLRGHDSAYQFQLGLFQIKQGRTTEGLATINALAPDQTNGYAPARLWLVRQALQQNPVLPLDKDSIEQQLLKVLKQQPENTDAHQLLSRIYFERREFQLAERHMTDASRFKPELNLQLAVLRQKLQRDPARIRSAAQLAVNAFSLQLEQDRGNSATRMALAEAQILAGEDVAARETLAAGLQQSDDPTLKKRLADFDLKFIDQRLKDSPLHRDACVPLVIAALRLDPSNVTGQQMVARLQSQGANIPADSLQSSVAYWEAALAADPENQDCRILLSQLHVTAGNLPAAIETLRPVVDSRPEFRLAFAQLLQQAGRTDESATILQTLCDESLAAIARESSDDSAAAVYAEALLLRGQSHEARSFLTARKNNPVVGDVRANPSSLDSVYGRACLAEFDQLTGFSPSNFDPNIALLYEIPESADPATLLELLHESLKCDATTISAIDRLALLSFSKHAAAKESERVIRQLRLEGDFGAEVLNKLGMFGLLLQKYETARGYLEQANARSRGTNPMILNNLAIATVRSQNSDPEKALALANRTLDQVPRNPDALSTRGEIYIALGRWNEAVADLTGAMQNRPPNAEIHRLLQKAYSGMPDADMAAEHGRKAAELEAAQASR